MPTEANLYYIHVPREARAVGHPVTFLTLDQFLANEEACAALWDMVTSQFHTRSKFLTIWPCVRYVALHADARGPAGMLLVSAPLNWQIDYVVVREDMRGRGIATSLVNETVNQALARNVPYIMLTSQERLRALYQEQCGFTPVAGTALPPVPARRNGPVPAGPG